MAKMGGRKAQCGTIAGKSPRQIDASSERDAHSSPVVKVRFLADADLSKAIATGVLRRKPSIDFLTAQAAGLRGVKDAEVLTLAARQQSALISHDVGAMPARFPAFRNAGNHGAGVFLVPQSLDIGIGIEKLLLISLASQASGWENRLEWLPL
jgi:hypothetical protein